MSISGNLKKSIFGYDIFISYSRKDSLDYAYAIAQYFMKKGFDCYIDQLSSITPGKELPSNIKDAVKRSTAFVLIGSEGAQTSEAIEQEICLFLENNKNRPLIPITIAGAINETAARWYKKIAGLALIDDSDANLKQGIPAQDVFDRIENALKFTKKGKRLRVVATGIGGISLLLIGLAIVASMKAIRAVNLQKSAEDSAVAAEKGRVFAEIRAQKADSFANKSKADALQAITQKGIADSLTDIAKAEKIEAERLSLEARHEAVKSARMAKSNFLAMNASTFRNSDPTLSYNLAKIAYQIAPENVYTYNAIANSVNGAPFYKDRVYLKGLSDFDYSPDKRTIVLIGSDKTLLLYNRISREQKIVPINIPGYSSKPFITYSGNGSHLLTMFDEPVILNSNGQITGIIKDTTVKAKRNDTYPILKTDSVSFDLSGHYVITWSTLFTSSSDKKTIQKIWNLQGVQQSPTTAVVPYKVSKRLENENWKLTINGKNILLYDKAKAEDFFEKDNYEPAVLRGHLGGEVQEVAFAPDGDEIASIGDDDYFILWNYQLPIEKKLDKLIDVKLSRSSADMIGFNNQTLFLRNISTNTEKRFPELKGVNDAEFFSDGSPYIISGTHIRVYNGSRWNNFDLQDTIRQVIEAHTKAFYLLLGKKSLAILYKDVNKARMIIKNEEINAVTLSNDAQNVAVLFSEDKAAVYNIEGKLIFKTADNITGIDFTPESKHFVVNKSWGNSFTRDSVTGALTIKVADHANLSLYDLKARKIWNYNDSLPLLIKFNGDWQHAITTNMLGENIYWNIEGNMKLFRRQSGMVGIGSAFTRDRRYYLSMAPLNLQEGLDNFFAGFLGLALFGDAEIPQVPQLWDVEQNRVYEFKRNDLLVKDAEFSPDEKFILVYDFEKNVTIWNVETKKQLELTGHYKKIKQVDFSDDGRLILTYSEDGTVRIWDYDGNEIYTFDKLGINPDKVGFCAKSDYIYIKKNASRKFKLQIGDDLVKDADTAGNEFKEANCEVIFKTINPAILLKQVDTDKQLGTVWEMNSALKAKYRIK